MTIKKINFEDFSKKQEGTSTSSGKIISAEDKTFMVFGQKDEEEPLEYSASDLLKAKEENYKKGHDDGYKKGKEEVESQVLSVEQQIEQGIKIISIEIKQKLEELDQEKEEYKKNLANLMHRSLKKALNDKVKENAGEVIEEMLSKLDGFISQEPEVVFSCNPEISDRIEEKISKIFNENNLTTKYRIKENPSLQVSNLQVEWANTGIIIDSENKINEIDEIINEYIKSL